MHFWRCSGHRVVSSAGSNCVITVGAPARLIFHCPRPSQQRRASNPVDFVRTNQCFEVACETAVQNPLCQAIRFEARASNALLSGYLVTKLSVHASKTALTCAKKNQTSVSAIHTPRLIRSGTASALPRHWHAPVPGGGTVPQAPVILRVPRCA